MKDTLDPAAYALPPALDADLCGLWTDGHFAVDGSDLAVLNMCIAAARPEMIIEIGTATGLSAAAMAVMQRAHGIDGEVRSYDLRDVLWFDPARSLGDLVPQIAGQVADRVHLTSGATALNVAEDVAPESAGMAFIDASHQHPWPLLDTLLLLPVLAPRAPIVHHDLQLFRNAGNDVGVGPKVLFDQLPPTHRLVASDMDLGPAEVQTPSRSVADNVFLMWRREALRRQGLELSAGLLLPWSLTDPLDDATVAEISDRLRVHYPGDVARNFEVGHKRFIAAEQRAAARVTPSLSRRLVQRLKR